MEIFNWSIFPLHWKISGWLPKHTPARGSPWPAGTYTNQFNTPMKCLSQVGRSLSSEFSNPSWLQYVPDIFNPIDTCVGHTHVTCWPCWALSGSEIFLKAVSYKCISALFHQIKSHHIISYPIHIPHQQLDHPDPQLHTPKHLGCFGDRPRSQQRQRTVCLQNADGFHV